MVGEGKNMGEKSVNILYTNYRGETKIINILPRQIRFGRADWDNNEQWLLDALDLNKQVERSFALKDIKAWFLK